VPPALARRPLPPDPGDEPHRHGSLGGCRQWVESVYDSLKGQLGLERHGGRPPHGIFTRIAQRLLALAAAIWPNLATGAPDKRSPTPYDTQPPASRNRSSSRAGTRGWPAAPDRRDRAGAPGGWPRPGRSPGARWW